MEEVGMEQIEPRKINDALDLKKYNTIGNRWIISGFIDNQLFIRETIFSSIDSAIDQDIMLAIAVYTANLEPLAFHIHQDLVRREFSTYFKIDYVRHAAGTYAFTKKTIEDLNINENKFIVYVLKDKRWYKSTFEQLNLLVDQGDQRIAVASISKELEVVGGFRHPDLVGALQDESQEKLKNLLDNAKIKASDSGLITDGVDIATSALVQASIFDSLF